MKIYFPDITFNNVPLVWDYDEKTNKAVCMFLSTEKVENSQAVLLQLGNKQYSGILLTSETAIIENVTSFTHTYPSKPFLAKLVGRSSLSNLHPEKEKQDTIVRDSPSKSLIRERSTSIRKITEPHHGPISSAVTIKEKERIAGSTMTKTLNSDKSTVSEKKGYSPHVMFERPQNSYESILLDDLIIKRDDPGLWGDTVGYKSYFTEKTEQDRLERSETHLRNESSFYKENQYLLNDSICPLKSEIIILIEQLLKRELNPAYQDWKKEQGDKLNPKILRELFRYLRGAVLNTMINESFNKEPTEYELLSEEDRHGKFHGNRARYEFANHEIRKSRARLMMMDWMVLFDESCPLELGSVCSLPAEATQMLTSFKEHLIKDTDRVKRLGKWLGILETLLIKSGEVERNNNKLTKELRIQLADKTKSIGEYSSLCGTVRTFLTKANQTHGTKHAVSDIVCQKFADQSVHKAIKLLLKDADYKPVPYVAKVQSTDNDLYLNKEWISGINSYLEHMLWEKIVKNLEVSKKSSSSMEKIEKLPWEKIVKHLTESKKSLASLDLISDKIYRIIKVKATISEQFAGTEETNAPSLEGDADDLGEKQTLNM